MNRYPEPTRAPERPYDAAVMWLACTVAIAGASIAMAIGVGIRAGLLMFLIGVAGAVLGVNNLMLELGNQGYVFKRGLDEEGHRCWKIGMRSGGGVIWL